MSSILFTGQNTPATPTSGKVRLFVDSADNTLKSIDSANIVTVYTGASAEQIQDVVGNFISAGSSKISVVYNDAGNILTIDIDPSQISHTSLQDTGTNTHAQIDSHISNISNPHSVTKSQVGLGNVQNLDQTNPVNIVQDSTHRFISDSQETSWNSKQDAITGGASSIVSTNLSISKALVSDSSGKVAASSVTSTELGYISGTTSNVQTQITSHITNTSNPHSVTKAQVGLGNVLNIDTTNPANISQDNTHRFVTDTQINSWDSKQSAITGAATTIVSSDLSASKTLVSDSSGKVAASSVTSTELGYLSGTTSTIQTQLNNKVDSNISISGATHTKITYDSKGLVTAGSQAAITDLSDVSISSPQIDQVLKWNGASWSNGSGSSVGAGSGVDYFFTATSSGISTYDYMSKSPDNSAEVQESITINNTTSPGFIDGYISNDTFGKTQIDSGIWNFNIYAYDGVGGSSIYLEVYKRTSSGVETLLFTTPSTATLSATVALYQIQTAQPIFSVNTTDRLLFKVYGVHTGGSNATISFVHSGTTHYSYVETPLVLAHNDLSGLNGGTTNEYYHLTNSEYSGTGTGVFVRSNSPNITTPTGIIKSDVGLGNVDNTSDATKNSAVVTLTNKTMSGNANTFSNIGYSSLSLSNSILNSDISSIAAIARSKLATLTASRAMVTDISGNDAVSTTTSTELGYVSGVTSAIQTQLNAKQATITGGATTITTTDLTVSKALVSDSSGKVAVSSVTSTELGYVSGVTSALQTQLSGKEPLITAGTTSQYYRGDKTFQILDKTAVGLANVDNTSDLNKPISSATQTALNGKEPTITSGTTAQYWRGDKSWQTLNSSSVGLGNVNNTSDSSKTITGDVTGTLGASTVSKIQGVNVANTVPTNGQVLKYNSTSTQWEPGIDNNSGGSGVAWTVTSVSNSALTLTSSSNGGQIFVGTVGGQVVVLPDATTLSIGQTYYLINKSDPCIQIKDNSLGNLTLLIPTREIKATLIDNSTTAGIWNIASYGLDYGQVKLYDDFISASATTNQIGALGWTITTGTVAYQAVTGNSLGVIRVNTTNTNNGVGALNLGTNLPVLLNNSATFMEMRVSPFSAAATGNAQYSVHVGLLNASTVTTPGTDPTVGLGFRFHMNTATAGNIFAFAANTTVTAIDSGIQAVVGNWYKCSMAVNAAGTVAYCYLNGVYFGTINTNMPTTTIMAPNLKISAGGTNNAIRSFDVDFYELSRLYTILR